MANANWNNPTLDSSYSDFVDEVKNRDEDVATQFTGTSATNIPTNAIQWDSTAKRWKLYDGSSFGELTDVYKLTALEVTGSTVPTNGIYLPATNTVGLSSNSSLKFQFNSSGAFGIGGATYGTSGQLLTSQGSSSAPTWTDAPTAGKFASYALICDEKAQNTDGGTFSSGNDTGLFGRKRDLNTELSDEDGIVSISSNDFTLGAGNYIIKWSCPAFDVARHQSALYDGTTLYYGMNAYSNTSYPSITYSTGVARVSPSSSTAFSIRHRCQTSKSGSGFGVDNNFGGDEIYTLVEIYKEN